MPNLKILTSVGYYLPGYKAGGPIRTLANMVDRLGGEFEFKIVTADRDFDDTMPYSEIKIDGWNRIGKAGVFYMSPKRRSLRDFRRLLCSTEYDILYLNSFFSPHFTIKPLLLRRMGLIPDRPLVIAPRGEFSPGALGLKSLKKLVYITAAKVFGLYKGAVWQASSEHEEADIRQWFGSDARVIIASNLPPVIHVADGSVAVKEKAKGCLKIIFLSRISRMKNLDGALDMLKGLKGKVEFNIYGPMEDKLYWAECQRIISSLPENIKVKYRGSLAHDKVSAVMREHDLFLFPTLGENFGHVILEAFCAGCPVLISDQTPWRNLANKKAGWDLPLEQPKSFKKVIQQVIEMDQNIWDNWSEGARQVAENFMNDSSIIEANKQLFYAALGQKEKE